MLKLNKNFVRNICKKALNEDLYPSGDITSALLDRKIKKKIKLISNQNGIIAGLDFAKEVKKPILIDFTGWACVNCRKIEENVWTRPEIFKILNEEIVLISLFVDDKTPLNDNEKFDVKFNDGSSRLISNIGQKWSTFQALNFKSVSQPYYVLIDPDLKILNPPIQYTNAIEYKAWLEDGLKNSRFNN